MNTEKEMIEMELNTGHGYSKTVIISGGTIDRSYVNQVLLDKNFDYIIAADAGLNFLHEEGIMPTHIVGDFDSLPQGILDDYMGNPCIKTRIYSPIKDKTDTEIAIDLAIELNSSEIWILGGTGGRIDHTMGNIYAMMIPVRRGVPCVLADDQNEIQLINHSAAIERSRAFGKYISFLPFGGCVNGLTVSGVKYPLNNSRLTPDNSLGVSNEIVEDTCVITFKDGILMVIQSRDKC